MRQRRCLCGAIVLLLVGMAGSLLAQSPQAQVVTLIGDPLSVERPGRSQPLSLPGPAALLPGDTLTTGPQSRATLLLSDGTQVRVNTNTRVELLPKHAPVRGHRVLLYLHYGEVRPNARPNWAELTDSLTVPNRGTELDLRVDRGTQVTQVAVLAGSADAFNAAGSKTIDAGFVTEAAPGQGPTPPVRFTMVGPGSLNLEWSSLLDRAQVTREQFFLTPDRAAATKLIPPRAAAVTAGPNDALAHRNLGDALFDAGQLTQALGEYQTAEQLSPNNPVTQTRIGDALFALGRLDDAATAYGTALAVAATSPTQSAGLLGQAWVALRHDRMPEAEALAGQAVAADPASAPAQIALGIARQRQPDRQAEARDALTAALTAAPEAYRYQAHAWLAQLALAQGNAAGAVAEATTAAQAAPASALAHMALSQALFFDGQVGAAEKEGETAARLTPDSVAAQLVKGQARLAAGDIDAAASAGAQAAALDPSRPEGFYLEGVADASLGNLTHADRELAQAAAVAPGFTPAIAARGRVLTREGHAGAAQTLLAAAVQGRSDDAALHQALGEAFYAQGHYGLARSELEAAARLAPHSAETQALLSRAALDDNHLDQAIRAAQTAVALAPGVAQYHALLGLAYSYGLETDFTGPDPHAEQEFREALALDPQNALSRLELGLLTFGAANGERPESRFANATAVQLGSISQGTSLFAEPARPKNAATALNSLTQAILFDPSVTNQTLQGGISTEVTPVIDQRKARSLFTDHRDQFFDGREHDLAEYRDSVDSSRARHSNSRDTDFVATLSLDPEPHTTVVGTLIHQRTSQQFPTYGAYDPFGYPTVTGAQESSAGDLGEVAVRRRIGSRDSLWAGLGALFTRDRFVSPLNDTPNLVGVSRNIVPEVRMDIALGGGRSPSGGLRLTVGAASAPQTVTTDFDVLQQSFSFGLARQAHDVPADAGFTDTTTSYRTRTAATNVYAQIVGPADTAFFVAGLLRQERLQTTTASSFSPGERAGGPQTVLLPSVLITYHPVSRTTLRLLAGRERQDTSLLTFLPTDTLLAMEPDVVPFGDADQTETLEVDAERYLSANTFLKLFTFHTLARDLVVGSRETDQPFPATALAGQVTRDGFGVRYEHSLSRTLFAKLYLLTAWTGNHEQVLVLAPTTSASSVPVGRLAFQSERSVQMSLDYIDHAGNKAGLRIRYEGEIQDEGEAVTPDGLPFERRFLFPSQTYLDVRLAKQPSVRDEVFLQINNVFNTAEIQFNNLPPRGRQIEVGVTFRF